MEASFALKHFHLMNPQAEVLLNGDQLYWETENGKRQHSITVYHNETDLEDAKKRAFGMNDVVFLENYRFTSTYTP